MQILELTYADFKIELIAKGFPINYRKIYDDVMDPTKYSYEVFAGDRGMFLWRAIVNDSTDIENFETNYKAKANSCLYSTDGKAYGRVESRPLDCTTVFTGCGDSANNIGDGTSLHWDFSNDDDLILSDSNIKRKRIEWKFLDPIYLKEGTLFYKDSPMGSAIDVYIVCPAGYYYYDNNNIPRLAAVDTPIAHYINKQLMNGTNCSGREFRTESCSSAIPNYYKFWLEVTTLSSDSISMGCITLVIYRKRTVIL